jgi:hypothetical protein
MFQERPHVAGTVNKILLLESIANVERNKLKDLLPKVNFFSITMDGNTDLI